MYTKVLEDEESLLGAGQIRFLVRIIRALSVSRSKVGAGLLRTRC